MKSSITKFSPLALFLLLVFLSTIGWTLPAQAVASQSFYQHDQPSDLADEPLGMMACPEGSTVDSKLIPSVTPPTQLVQPSVSEEISPRTSPYRILAAARHKSHLAKVHRTSFKISEIPSVIAQMPAKVNQLRTRVAAATKQQFEQFKTILNSEKNGIQQLSSEQIERKRHDLDALLEYAVKAPLRSAFQRLERLSHRAVRKLA